MRDVPTRRSSEWLPPGALVTCRFPSAQGSMQETRQETEKQTFESTIFLKNPFLETINKICAHSLQKKTLAISLSPPPPPPPLHSLGEFLGLIAHWTPSLHPTSRKQSLQILPLLPSGIYRHISRKCVCIAVSLIVDRISMLSGGI